MKFLLRALNKCRLLPFLNLSSHVTINGHRFRIPVLNGVGYGNIFMTEPWMVDVLKRLDVGAAGSFLDVGANIGQTILKVRSAYPEIGYVGFEPNPTCVHYLNALVAANRFQDVRVFPVAISDSETVLELNLYGDRNDDTSASILEDFRPSSKIVRKMYIPSYLFKTLYAVIGNTRFSVVKIDVEGAELEVLQSLVDLMAEQRPYLLMEVLPAYNAENTYRLDRQARLQEIIRRLDYAIFRIGKKGPAFEKFIPLEEFGIHSNVEWSDYLIVPKESVSRFQ